MLPPGRRAAARRGRTPEERVPTTHKISCAAFVIAAVALGCFLPSSGPRLEPPGVALVGIGDLSPGPFEQRFRIDLRLSNPNPGDLELDGIDFQLEIDGNPITRALSGERVVVPRLGETRVSLSATTSLVELLRQLGRPRSGQGAPRYEMRGRVLLAGSAQWLPFTASGDLLP